MTTNKPYDIQRWESPKEPTQELLSRILIRDGFEPVATELPAHFRSQEEKFPSTRLLVPATGKIQVSFPGYGSVNLLPGDTITIFPDILHDLIVEGSAPCSLLQAFQ